MLTILSVAPIGQKKGGVFGGGPHLALHKAAKMVQVTAVQTGDRMASVIGFLDWTLRQWLCCCRMVLVGALAFWISGCPSGSAPGVDETDGAHGPDGSGELLQEEVQGEVALRADAVGEDGLFLDSGGDASVADDPLDSFFSLEQVHTIELFVDAAGYEALRVNPKEYVKGSVRVDGVEYPDVGVRLKGGLGSFVAIDEVAAQGRRPAKSAFIIDFNRYVKGQGLYELKKLTLNNMVQDPSGIHQYVGYTLFRHLGIPASRSGFARVSFNGNDKGLYAAIESPDNKVFTKRWFGSDKGNLYEGAGADFTKDAYVNFDQDRGDDTSKEDLRILSELLDVVAEGDAYYDLLDANLDFNEYLLYVAAEIYFAHWDGYACNTNNYMVYHAVEEGSWLFMPWGIDQLFEDNSLLGPYYGLMKGVGPTWEKPDRGIHSMLGGGNLQRQCFKSAKCRAALAAQVRVVSEAVEGMGVEQLVAEARAIVEPSLLEEAEEFGDPGAVVDALDGVSIFLEARSAQMEKWLPCLEGGSVDYDGDGYDGCTVDCVDWDEGIFPGAVEQCNLQDDDCNGVLDDAAECPDCYELVLASGSYSVCFQPRTWLKAQEQCRNRGQELASIHDNDTALILPWNLLEKTGYIESWIGLNDIEQEGVHVWSDGSSLDFDNRIFLIPAEWGAFLDCHCQTLLFGWTSQVCWDKRPFVCKAQ